MITGTFSGASIVALPHSVTSLASVQFSMLDAVATVVSPFTGVTQTQQWLGADAWQGTVTLPPLSQSQADAWISFLMECRGMANCFLLGDPMRSTPNGRVQGVPLVDMTVTGNAAGSQTLNTKGWTPNSYRLLLPGDYLQIGNRLHRVLDQVNSDANGKATLSIWPSIRDTLTDGQTVILNNPQGLFRLATNKRTWSSDATLLTHITFQVTEFR